LAWHVDGKYVLQFSSIVVSICISFVHLFLLFQGKNQTPPHNLKPQVFHFT